MTLSSKLSELWFFFLVKVKQNLNFLKILKSCSFFEILVPMWDSSSNVNATAKRRLANDNFDHFLSIFKFFSPFLAFLAIYVFNHLSPFRTLKILKFNLLILNNSKFSQSLKKIGNDDEGLVDFSRGATYVNATFVTLPKKIIPPPSEKHCLVS